MNEFTVWDEENYIGNDDRFYTPSDLSLDGFYLQIIDDGKLILTDICDDGEYTAPKQIKIQTFPYIGKTDINNKKIYADCSIVEFELHSPYENDKDSYKLKGFFYFCNDELRIKLRIFKHIHGRADDLYFNKQMMSNLKIIDTIQENKLGLIKS